jgi:hypothetical protein
VRTLREDPEEGAKMFVQFGNMILGTDAEEEDDDTTTPSKDTDMTEKNDTSEAPAWAQVLVEKIEALEKAQGAVIQNTEAQEIAAFKAEARSLGYVEGTDDWVTFFKIAASDLADGDLNAAHEMFTKLYGVPTDESENVEDGEGEEADPEPTPKFPATGGAGGAGSPKPAETADKPDMSKEAVTQRARSYLTAAADPAASVAP